MKLVIKILGILLILAGTSMIINPEYIFGWIEDNMENRSLYIFAIITRLVLGFLLIWAGNESKYPLVFKFFGYVAVIAAIFFIWAGHEEFKYIVSAVLPEFKPYAAVSGIIIFAFGSFLFYAVSGFNNVKK